MYTLDEHTMKRLLQLQKSSARRLALSVIHSLYTKDIHVQSALSNTIALYALSPEEIAFGTELTYGYLRYAIQIEAIIKEHLHTIHKIPHAFILLLGLSLYELLYTDSSFASNVVFHTVEIAKLRYSPALGRVANAVLREVLRKKEEYITYSHQFKQCTTQDEQYALQYALPLYMWNILTEQFHEEAHSYAQYFLQRPMRTEGHNPSTIELFKKLEITQLAHGRIWECCSGRGGKKRFLSTQEIAPIIASDISRHKLQAHATHDMLLCIDATCPPFKKESFSLVIADVPCSGMGTLRKRPDIKLRRKEHDIQALCNLQSAILEGIAPTVEQGGYIVYITCSIYKEENERQITRFIQSNREFTLQHQYTLPLDESLNDIFYGAILQKKSIY